MTFTCSVDSNRIVGYSVRLVIVLFALVALAGTVAIVGAVDGETTANTDVQQDNETELVAFTAESQGGYVAFSEETESEAIEGGTAFPAADEGDQPIVIEATVEDGEWESTSITFPPLPVTDDLDAEVEAVDGLEGEIDPETGEMTAEGTFEVTIQDATFTFESQQVTSESNELRGEAAFEDDSGSVTLVDNEFVVEDETENEVINRVLELPAEEPGENWFRLELDISLGEEETEQRDTDSDDSADTDQDQSSDEEGDSEETSTLVATVLGQAVAFVALGSAGVAMVVTLVARFTGLISLDS